MRALIVDDELEVRTALAACVGLVGCDGIDTAMSGAEALKMALLNRYDLITVDLQMPGVGGLDILETLRTTCPQGVIAVISGHVDKLTNSAAQIADVAIEKPFNTEHIKKLAKHAKFIAENRAAIQKLGNMGGAPQI